MTQTSALVDRTALDAHRTRAQEHDRFLHTAALSEVQDRLEMVNKSFTKTAIITPYPDIWRAAYPKAVIRPDDDILDLDAAKFDLVVHAMCLHWANDPVGQLIQCRHALRPDGLSLTVCLGGQTLAELRSVLSEAEVAETGGLSPRVLSMPEIRDLGGLLQRAGFALPVADNIVMTARYKDLTHLMHDLRAMGENNALAGRVRHASRRGVFERAAVLYNEHFGTPDGLPASFEMITLTGWAPAPDQPKPLRPGSAQARLADALNTAETKLPD